VKGAVIASARISLGVIATGDLYQASSDDDLAIKPPRSARMDAPRYAGKTLVSPSSGA
jgi:hypothetical protein